MQKIQEFLGWRLDMDNGTSHIVDYEGVIWMGLHFGLAWASYAQWIIVFFMDFVRIGLRKLKLAEFSSYTIANDAKSLSKIPHHLAVITEDDAGLEDLANIVLWTCLLGVSCITLHCRNGFKSQAFEEFIKICGRKKAELKDCLIPITYHNESRVTTGSQTGCQVLLSSAAWGRRKLVDTARSLCAQVKDGSLRPEEIDLNKVSVAIKDDLLEPNLAINFSSYPTLNGLDPWDSRLTEIITAESLKGISYSKFLHVMKRYAGTKQRFGK